MKQFTGFPDRMEFAALPGIFFSALLPEISDMAELKTTLHVLASLYRKRGYPRFVTRRELRQNAGLMSCLRGLDKPDEALKKALSMATERGTFIHIPLDRDDTPEDIYLLNTAANQRIAAQIGGGELKLEGLKATGQPRIETGPLPDIFTLYEQNIGMLTPMIAEELKEAEKSYPQDWLRDAIKEAVALNKRNWRYIARILERWSAEGKSDGAHQRDSKEDPTKYFKGKYGHMVQR